MTLPDWVGEGARAVGTCRLPSETGTPSNRDLDDRDVDDRDRDRDRPTSVPVVDTERFGQVLAPRTLPELLAVADALSESNRADHWEDGVAWRGQARVDWKITSGAMRRLPDWPNVGDMEYEAVNDHGGKLPEESASLSEEYEGFLRQYEARLVHEARLAGHHHAGGAGGVAGVGGQRMLGDLELLAALQHFGAATRMLDFTRNLLVAAWFATRDREHRDKRCGVLAGLPLSDDRHHTARSDRRLVRMTAEDLREGRPQLLPGPLLDAVTSTSRNADAETGEEARPGADALWWEPRGWYERMRVQQSLLVLARVRLSRWGTTALPARIHQQLPAALDKTPRVTTRESGGMFFIAVPTALKEDCHRRLPALTGYSAATLFPDLEGYARAQGHDQGLYALSPYLAPNL